MPGGGVTSRYAAYALALKLKCPDVDAMLDGMSIMQFMEWQAFFKIREEERAKEKGHPPGTATAPPENILQARITSGFDAAIERRQKARGQNR